MNSQLHKFIETMAAISWYQMTGDMVKFTEIFRVLIVAGNTPVVTYNDTNMSLNKKKKKKKTLFWPRWSDVGANHLTTVVANIGFVQFDVGPTNRRRHPDVIWKPAG